MLRQVRAAARWVTWRRMVLAVVLLALVLVGRSWVASYSAWQQARRKQGFLEEMDPPRAGERILIFAPHPDDEMLGCGGLMQRARASGAQVDVALMTNGDASEVARLLGERDLLNPPQAMIDVGRRRQGESLAALRKLGLAAKRIHFLSYPNGGLTELWQPTHWLYDDVYRSPYTRASRSPYPRSVTPHAPYCGQQLLSDVVAVLQQVRPTEVFVTHERDVHPDHWATDSFVRYGLATLAARGDAWATKVEVYGYLIHFPHFPAPARASTRLKLLPPADLSGPEAHWVRLELTPEMARAKMRGIRAYASQAPLFDRLLLDFGRANESFEALSGDEMTVEAQKRWSDMSGRWRGLGGAELEEVGLTVFPDGHVRADLTNHNRKIGKRAYLAVDLRSWDNHGASAIVEVQLGRGGAVKAWRLSGGRVEDIAARVSVTHPDGIYSITFPGPPQLLTAKSFFLTCWGSYKDHTVDSGVVSSIRLHSG